MGRPLGDMQQAIISLANRGVADISVFATKLQLREEGVRAKIRKLITYGFLPDDFAGIPCKAPPGLFPQVKLAPEPAAPKKAASKSPPLSKRTKPPESLSFPLQPSWFDTEEPVGAKPAAAPVDDAIERQAPEPEPDVVASLAHLTAVEETIKAVPETGAAIEPAEVPEPMRMPVLGGRSPLSPVWSPYLVIWEDDEVGRWVLRESDEFQRAEAAVKDLIRYPIPFVEIMERASSTHERFLWSAILDDLMARGKAIKATARGVPLFCSRPYLAPPISKDVLALLSGSPTNASELAIKLDSALEAVTRKLAWLIRLGRVSLVSGDLYSAGDCAFRLHDERN